MSTLKSTLEIIAVLYVIVSGFSAWVWLTGGFKSDGRNYSGFGGFRRDLVSPKIYTRDEKTQNAKNAFVMGTVLIWALVGFCAVMGLFLWVGGLLLHL